MITARRGQRVLWTSALLLAFACAGCGTNGTVGRPVAQSATTHPAPGAIPSAAAPSVPSVASPTSAKPAGTAMSGPGTVCDADRGNRIVVNRGNVDCATAVRVINQVPGMGEAAPPDIDGWKCGRLGGTGAIDAFGYNYVCNRGDDQVVKQTLASGQDAPIPANWVDANTYFADSAGQSGYYFSTPSSKFLCAIIGSFTAGSEAGCHGRIPADATAGPKPNTIMSVQGAIGTTFHRGDPQFQRLDGGTTPVLAYGSSLYVLGYTCTVDYSAGTTCRNSRTGHGFTVNDVRAEFF